MEGGRELTPRWEAQGPNVDRGSIAIGMPARSAPWTTDTPIAARSELRSARHGPVRSATSPVASSRSVRSRSACGSAERSMAAAARSMTSGSGRSRHAGPHRSGVRPPGRRSAAGLRMQRFGDEAGKEADADRQEANAVGDSLHGKGIRQGGSLGHRDRSRCSPALAEAAIDPLPDHEFGRIMRSRRARTAGGPRRRPARRPPPPTGSTDIQ